jgi:ribokinase
VKDPAGESSICVVGNLTLDDTFIGNDSFPSAPGGDALYVALGARWWGLDVAILSRVGEDYPPEHLDWMRRVGIDVRAIRRLHGPTVHYRVQYHGPEQRAFEHLTDPVRLDELSPTGGELTLIDRARWVHVAAMPIERQAEAIDRARAAKVPYSLDPHEEYITGHEAQLAGLIDGSIFLPSELEASLLSPGLSVEQTLDRFSTMGAHGSALKLGAAGSIAHARGQTWRIPALSVRVVDPTGAGDAYCGGFVAGLLSTGSVLAGACCGTVSAAHIIQGFGALHSPPPTGQWMADSAKALLQGRYDGEGDRVLTLLTERL